MRRAAVLGSPISHSLSPVLHRAAYAALGLTGWDLHRARGHRSPSCPTSCRASDADWAGLSLTMPLKAAVLPLLDAASPVVEVVGAANTVLLRDGRRLGDNTDVPGWSRPWPPVRTSPRGAVRRGARRGSDRPLGAGRPGRRHGRRPGVRPDTGRATALTATAEAVGLRLSVRPWAGAAEALSAPLVVNTTPAGAADALVAQAPTAVGTLFEVLYDPWPTPLAAAWRARGGQVVDGLDLLVHQAVLQVGLMTGADVEGAGTAGLDRRDALGRGARAARDRELPRCST